MKQVERYEIVRSKLQLKRLVKKLKNLEEFAFDTETNSLRVFADNEVFRIVGISISWSKSHNYYIPLGHVFDDRQLSISYVARQLQPIFANPNIRLIAHNAKFDVHVFKRIGIDVATNDIWDTMIADFLIDENRQHKLEKCAEREFGVEQVYYDDVVDTVTKEEKKEMGLSWNSKASFDLVRLENAEQYVTDDSYYAWELYLKFIDLLEQEEMESVFYDVYRPFIRVLFDMEEEGVNVDLERLEEMKEEITKDIEELEYSIYEIAGVEFNPNSNQQLAQLLFGYDGYKNPKQELLDVSFNFPIESETATGNPSTGKSVLKSIAKTPYKRKRKKEGAEMVSKLLEFKKLRKLKTSFLEGLKEELYPDSKAHPSFNIIGATSGRISCSHPNLQQLPKADDEDKYQIRSLFYVKENRTMVAFDYANLEMRILAHFSEDPHLLETFLNDHDSHGATAVNMFEHVNCKPDEVKEKYPKERTVAKVLNFGLIYGMSPYSLYKTLYDFGVDDITEEKAEEYYDQYFANYVGVDEFITSQKRFAKRHGYVYTLTGRKRRLPDINSSNYRKAGYNERLAVNAPIQGSAGDIIENAQVKIHNNDRLKELDAKMLIQIHDELVFSIPYENLEESISIIKDKMEHPFGDAELKIPLKVDYDTGENYQQAK